MHAEGKRTPSSEKLRRANMEGAKRVTRSASPQSIGRKRVCRTQSLQRLVAWAGGWHGTTAKQPLQWASLHWLLVDLNEWRQR